MGNENGHPTYLIDAVSIDEIVQILADYGDCKFQGDNTVRTESVSALSHSLPSSLSYCSRDVSEPVKLPVGMVVLCSAANSDKILSSAKVVTEDPRSGFIQLLNRWLADGRIDFRRTVDEAAASIVRGEHRIADSAFVDSEVIIGKGAEIGPGAVIMTGSVIGQGTKIRAGAVVGESGIALHKGTDGSVLSQPHIGTVVIGSNSEIGANAVVARAMLGRTQIGDRTMIGNLCNIGHGAKVGQNVWMSVGCLIGGHSMIMDGATFAMGAVVRDNVAVGEGAQIGMGSVVTRAVEKYKSIFGNPAQPIRSGLKAGPER